MQNIFLSVLIFLCTLLGCQSLHSRRFPDGFPIPEEIANYTTEPCEIDLVKGTCVSLPSCKEYMELLANPDTRLAGAEVVKKMYCGRATFLPKVCCPGYKKDVTTEANISTKAETKMETET